MQFHYDLYLVCYMKQTDFRNLMTATVLHLGFTCPENDSTSILFLSFISNCHVSQIYVVNEIYFEYVMIMGSANILKY